MKCPRCGADNGERAERCYLCDYAFTGAVETQFPDEPPRAQYPPPTVPPQGQAVPPPPIAGTGDYQPPPPGAESGGYQPPPPGAYPGAYQPPPPGAYSGGYQPPPPGAYPGGFRPPAPAARGSNKVKMIIGVLVVVLVAIVGVAGYFFIRGKTYTIEVPLPPGYVEADQATFEDAKESIQADDSDARLDHLFLKQDNSSFVFVAHQRFLLSELPPDDPEGAERYYIENKDELLDEMNSSLELDELGYSGDIEVTEYETVKMGTGDTALHMSIEMTIQQVSMIMDMLAVVKGKTMFMIIIEGIDASDAAKTLDFLRQNVTFTE